MAALPVIVTIRKEALLIVLEDFNEEMQDPV